MSLTTYTVDITYESIDGKRESRTVRQTVAASKPGPAVQRALNRVPQMLAWGSVVIVVERQNVDRQPLEPCAEPFVTSETPGRDLNPA